MDLTIFINSNSQKTMKKTIFKEIKIEFNFNLNLFNSVYKLFERKKLLKSQPLYIKLTNQSNIIFLV
jgi:hypothetical protein